MHNGILATYLLFMEPYCLSRRELHTTLNTLDQESAPHLTVYMQPRSFPSLLLDAPQEASAYLSDKLKHLASSESVQQAANRYRTGAVLFWQNTHTRLLIIPPFPVPQDRVVTGAPETGPLRTLMNTPRILGVVLVTWGAYAVGVIQEDRLVAQKCGTGHIHKEHKKGGSSQKRFARRTEEQRRNFLKRAAARVDEQFAGYSLNWVFFGGNRLILPTLTELSHELTESKDTISHRILETRRANHEALRRSNSQIHTALAFTTCREPNDSP